jgi:hypothetical protein
MAEHRALDNERKKTHAADGQHSTLRGRAVEDALIELMGPVGETKACERNPVCSRDDKLPDGDNRNLYADLAALAKLDGGSSTNRFKTDLKFINDQLTYTRVVANKQLPPDNFALPILGINMKTQRVLLSQKGEVFELVNQDGLRTVVPATASAKPEHSAQSKIEEQPKQADAIEKISADAVNQVSIGNCYFLACAASLAEEQPDAIQKMISRNPNGTFTVTFPGDSSRPQTVDPPNHAEGDVIVNGPNSEWVEILAKAYRKLTGISLYDPGGTGERALELLTGKVAISTPIDALAHSNETKAQEVSAAFIQNALSRHAPVVASSRSSANKYTDQDGIIRSHTYSVFGYDAGKNLVTLRNPQGLNETNKEQFRFIRPGVFQLPLNKFVHDFWRVTTVQT